MALASQKYAFKDFMTTGYSTSSGMLVLLLCVSEYLRMRHLIKVIFHFLKSVLSAEVLMHTLAENYSMNTN